MSQVVIKRLDRADELREFDKGSFEVVDVGGMTIGRARYEPGWKWSEHVGVDAGKRLCDVEHVGMVVSGRCAVEMEDGTVVELAAGDVFYVPPGHDSWVIGDEPYVSLHFMGAERYAEHG